MLFPIIHHALRNARKHRLLLIFSLTIFFWTLFDGIITYFTPILIVQRGFSNFQMGLIISSSSLFGAILDFILAKVLKGSNYLHTLLIILGISFFYPLTLWYSSHILIYLLAMFIWGLYWDLYHFVSYDFVAQTTEPSENCFSFSFLGMFRSVALMIAPLIAGFLVIDQIEISSMLVPSIFLIIAGVFYSLLISHSPHIHSASAHSHRHSFSWLKEFRTLFSLASHIVPFLFLSILLITFDSAIWTLGPLLSPLFPAVNNFSGILMTLYILPTLFSSLYIDAFVQKFGKKRLGFISFILSTLLLLPVFFVSSPYLIIFLFFASSLVSSVAWPSVSGFFTDLVEVHPTRKEEYESLSDFSVNIGFIIGPTLVGFLSDHISLSNSLGILSIFCFISTLIIYLFYFRHSPSKSTF